MITGYELSELGYDDKNRVLYHDRACPHCGGKLAIDYTLRPITIGDGQDSAEKGE